MQDICSRLFSLAGPYLTVRHNQKHTEICYEFALRLLRHLKGRPEIVLPAIILHDVGWSAVPSEQHLLAFGPRAIDEELRRVHEIEGAKIAADILEQESSLSEYDRFEICRIIESHDSGDNPISLEEKIVKDSDKLFRFSPEGFSIDVERFSIDSRGYWEKLHEYRDQWFHTDLARELASGELQKIERELNN